MGQVTKVQVTRLESSLTWDIKTKMGLSSLFSQCLHLSLMCKSFCHSPQKQVSSDSHIAFWCALSRMSCLSVMPCAYLALCLATFYPLVFSYVQPHTEVCLQWSRCSHTHVKYLYIVFGYVMKSLLNTVINSTILVWSYLGLRLLLSISD